MNEANPLAPARDAPVLVFLHGGVHTGACWDDTTRAITDLRPGIETLAVDLPGRRGIAGDLATLTIEECVSSVCDQILDNVQIHRNRPLIMIGHSLAGVVLPGVVNRLGPGVRQVIFVATCLPPVGQCVVDTLHFGFQPIVRRIANRSPVIAEVPYPLMRWAFGNRATGRQRARMRAHFCSESSRLITEIQTVAFPKSVRTSWILTSRDRALKPAVQRKFIDSLGGVDDVVVMNAGHEVMFTHPQELAATIRNLAR